LVENDVTKLRRSKGVMKWVAIAGVFAVMAPPLAYAAVQEVKVTNEPTVKVGNVARVKGTTNVGQLGLFGTKPISGAIRNMPVPGAFLGAGDCLNTDDPAGNAQSSNVTIPADGGNTVVTGIIITGRPPLAPGDTSVPNGAVYVSTDAVQSSPGNPVNLLEARVNEANPNVTVDLGPGLALTDDLHFEGRAYGGGDGGDCAFAVLGYAKTSELGG
jgi:hypothetical protein